MNLLLAMMTLSVCITQKSVNKRAATAYRNKLWPNGTIPYVIDFKIFGSQQIEIIHSAISLWEKSTCLVFIPRARVNHDYVLFTKKECGCCSFVGRIGGMQEISLGDHCISIGSALHEIGHVLGYWHEHARPDRDDYIKIQFQNVIIGREFNFFKRKKTEINSLGEPYDYESIMHYTSNAFAIYRDLLTIVPLRNSPNVLRRMGQRNHLSPGDIRQTNLLYECGRFTNFDGDDGFINIIEDRGNVWRFAAGLGQECQISGKFINNEWKTCNSSQIYVETITNAASSTKIDLCSENISFNFTAARISIKIKNFSRPVQISIKRICGGNVTVDSIYQIESPSSRRSNIHCHWNLRSNKAKESLHIYFHVLRIKRSRRCADAYLKIFEGNESRTVTFCGSDVPDPIVANNEEINIIYYSRTAFPPSQFLLSVYSEIDECGSGLHSCDHICINTLAGYECDCYAGFQLARNGLDCEKSCGGVLEGDRGEIISPNYPEEYPNEFVCKWIVKVQRNYVVYLQFLSFDVEFEQNCLYDSVAVKEESGEQIGRFCGNKSPPDILSTGNSIVIIFLSDFDVSGRGFRLRFQKDFDECLVQNCSHFCRNIFRSFECYCRAGFYKDGFDCHEESCKYHIKELSSVVESPGWPFNYLSDKNCSWTFSTRSGFHFVLKVGTFELEDSFMCRYDFLEITEKVKNEVYSQGKFCGTNFRGTFYSWTNKIKINFVSDSSQVAAGFQIFVKISTMPLLRVTSSKRSLYSHPFYGSCDYKNLTRYQWLLTRSNGDFIHFKFAAFSLENHKNCEFDYVRIYSGQTAQSPLVLNACGKGTKNVIKVNSDFVLIRFFSDQTVTATGFHLLYWSESRKD